MAMQLSNALYDMNPGVFVKLIGSNNLGKGKTFSFQKTKKILILEYNISFTGDWRS